MTIGLFLCLVSLSTNAQVESSIPQTHLNLPVLVSIPIVGGNESSSGFILQDKGWCYFVTTKHVLYGRDSVHQKDTLIGKSAILRIPDFNVQDTSVSILRLDLNLIQTDNRIFRHKSADVAMVRIGECDSVGMWPLPGTEVSVTSHNGVHVRKLEMLTRYSDVKIGNNIYVYGYPTSIGLVSMPQFDFTKPLLRKGIIAGKYDNTHTIILDCPVYYGNSGGPVIEESPEGMGSKFKIIGIITQWIPFDESQANKNTVRQGALYTNSGYAVSESVDKILEILAELEATGSNKNVK